MINGQDESQASKTSTVNSYQKTPYIQQVSTFNWVGKDNTEFSQNSQNK